MRRATWPEINTDGYEGFPTVSPNGELYFSSNGHLGMGGLDVFVAELKERRWQNVRNLQSPTNSPADDFGLVIEPYLRAELIDSIEQIGYFSSSREGGRGQDDLYQWVLPVKKKIDTPVVVIPPPKPEVVYMLRVNVGQQVLENPEDPNSRVTGRAPLSEAIVQVLGLDAESSISRRLVANNQGNITLMVEPNTDYRVTASQAGFFNKSHNTTTKGRTKPANSDTVWVDLSLTLDRIYQRREIVLQNIYYDLASFAIREDAKPTLNQLAETLVENPTIRIELGSHTDARGSDKYNLTLSQQRAQAAIDYLATRGVNIERLSARGYGETQLVNRCANNVECSEEEHQQNRRTTFKVVADNFISPN